MKYPKIAAIDFENIISITIHHLLKYGSAKPGLFGEILSYTFAVEEQNCGELHAHLFAVDKIILISHEFSCRFDQEACI